MMIELDLFFLQTSSKCKWYCLLPESIGRHKRVPLNVEKRRTTPSMTNGMIVNVRRRQN